MRLLLKRYGGRGAPGVAGELVKWWRDHSLTIVCWVLGVALTALAFAFEPGRVFDLILGLGAAMITVALFYSLAGPLTERNKPEEPAWPKKPPSRRRPKAR